MKILPTHTIAKTFLNRNGGYEVRNTNFYNYTDVEARQSFMQHVESAESQWRNGTTWNGVPVRTTRLVLKDKDNNVVEEWDKEDT